MRIMLSICTVLATASMAEAQLGSVTGTVQQTTDLEREELELDSTSRLGSRLQAGQPTSRLELMRQQRALREARRAGVEARETAGPDSAAAQASAVTETTLQADDTAQAAAQTRSAASANPERMGATAAANAQAEAIDSVNAQGAGQASANIEPDTAVVETATSRVLTDAEIAARSARTNVTANVPPAANVQVQLPETVTVSQGRSRAYYGPVTGSDTIVVRDRRVVYEDEAANAPIQPAAASPSPSRTAPRASDTMWIDRGSISEHAFPLTCALLLILSLLLALRLLATPRRRRA